MTKTYLWSYPGLSKRFIQKVILTDFVLWEWIQYQDHWAVKGHTRKQVYKSPERSKINQITETNK